MTDVPQLCRQLAVLRRALDAAFTVSHRPRRDGDGHVCIAGQHRFGTAGQAEHWHAGAWRSCRTLYRPATEDQ